MSRQHLLTSAEMARFAARGFLRFDALVPEDVNRRFLEAVADGPPPGIPPGTPLADGYAGHPVREVLDLPRVQGVIRSLVGRAPLLDHHFLHVIAPASRFEGRLRVLSQHTHQDSTIDPRTGAFDVQLFYFPHEVGPDGGGTRFLPGSHLRIVSETAIARYQNVVGQQRVTCPAGSLFVFHHGLWHGGEINRGENTRRMFKIRLNPTEPQVRLWNTDDLPDTPEPPRPIFDLHAMGREPDPDDVTAILCQPEPWFEFDTSRLEWIGRIRFWRRLLGDPDFDADYWLTRLENEPGR